MTGKERLLADHVVSASAAKILYGKRILSTTPFNGRFRDVLTDHGSAVTGWDKSALTVARNKESVMLLDRRT